jgi:hypothetical protein
VVKVDENSMRDMLRNGICQNKSFQFHNKSEQKKHLRAFLCSGLFFIFSKKSRKNYCDIDIGLMFAVYVLKYEPENNIYL